MQSMCMATVVLNAEVMSTNGIVNLAEYQRTCQNVYLKKTKNYRVMYGVEDNLIQYFQSLYGIHQMYELKGLKITKYDITASNNVKGILKNTSLDQHKCLKNNCFAVAFYSICYSSISSCSYWNSKTLLRCNHSKWL